MFDRHEFFCRAMPVAASLAPAAAIAGAQTSPTLTANSTARLNTFGPEADRLSRRSGLWDVVETVWDRPEGKPVTTSGLVLERAMLGSVLQEILRPPRSRAHRHARVQSDGRALRLCVVRHASAGRTDAGYSFVRQRRSAKIRVATS